ncbi:MAG: hypothetical protein C0611_01600 [Desulfobacteraceae bacterium]|nr:MAG: hypothetical protein C0611_01600 [Desulfobacteraceae bacterium]
MRGLLCEQESDKKLKEKVTHKGGSYPEMENEHPGRLTIRKQPEMVLYSIFARFYKCMGIGKLIGWIQSNSYGKFHHRLVFFRVVYNRKFAAAECLT